MPAHSVIQHCWRRGPLTLFGRQNIQVTVAIDIGDIERVAVLHIFVQQLTTDPGFLVLGVSHAFMNH